MDPLVLLTDVDEATEHLLRTVADLDPARVSAPSLLPGWTVGHVLTHVARNADAQINLLTWARTGVETPMYPSPEARAEGIEAGAARPLREQIADIRATHERFADAAAAMPAAAWAVRLHSTGQSAAAVPWSRLREVVVHHVDLGAGYTPADWTDAFALRLLREITAGVDGPPMRLRPYGIEHALTIGTADDPPVVGGPTRSRAAGGGRRGGGAPRTLTPDRARPHPPPRE